VKTRFGLVAVSAFVSLYYVSGLDTKLFDEEEKKRFIAVFARRSLNRELSVEEFERLKLAVEYYDEMAPGNAEGPDDNLGNGLDESGRIGRGMERERCPISRCGNRTS
jgi:hypothetical protein